MSFTVYNGYSNYDSMSKATVKDVRRHNDKACDEAAIKLRDASKKYDALVDECDSTCDDNYAEALRAMQAQFTDYVSACYVQ